MIGPRGRSAALVVAAPLLFAACAGAGLGLGWIEIEMVAHVRAP